MKKKILIVSSLLMILVSNTSILAMPELEPEINVRPPYGHSHVITTVTLKKHGMNPLIFHSDPNQMSKTSPVKKGTYEATVIDNSL